MKRITSKKFKIPQKLVDDIYEVSGGPERFKGFVLVTCDEMGNPVVTNASDGLVTKLGLERGIEKFLSDSE
jgi:hypothetical protein